MSDTADFITGERNYVDSAGGASLPPGVHPNDPRVGIGGSGAVTQADTPHPFVPGPKAWSTDNAEALPVNERGSKQWSAGWTTIDAEDQESTVQVVGRQPGRKSVTVWVPITAPDGTTSKGIILAPEQGSLGMATSPNIVVLNPGDSITIYSEAPVYASVISGNTVGTYQFVAAFDPPGFGRGLP